METIEVDAPIRLISEPLLASAPIARFEGLDDTGNYVSELVPQNPDGSFTLHQVRRLRVAMFPTVSDAATVSLDVLWNELPIE